MSTASSVEVPSLRVTKREIEILALAASGLCDKEIGSRLNLQICTVRTYWDRLRKKLSALNRTHAVCLAMALGWVEVDITELMMRSHAQAHSTGGVVSVR